MVALTLLVAALFGAPHASPSPEPTPTPVPTATPRPNDTEWLAALWNKRYASRSGAAVDLATVMGQLKDAMTYELGQQPSAATTVGFDRKAGLLDVCFNPARSRCEFSLIVRRRDVTAPPVATSMHVGTHAIGETLARLQAQIAADRSNDTQRLVFYKSPGGTVLGVVMTDTNPPPWLYDHGFQSWVTHYYVIRDGAVAAHGWKYGEN